MGDLSTLRDRVVLERRSTRLCGRAATVSVVAVASPRPAGAFVGQVPQPSARYDCNLPVKVLTSSGPPVTQWWPGWVAAGLAALVALVFAGRKIWPPSAPPGTGSPPPTAVLAIVAGAPVRSAAVAAAGGLRRAEPDIELRLRLTGGASAVGGPLPIVKIERIADGDA